MKTIDTKTQSYSYTKATKSLLRYFTEISKFRPLSREEEALMFMEAQTNPKVLETIYKHNLLFVVTVAKRYSYLTNATLTLEDLINEGNIGLMKALHRFDYKTGNKFISYAVWWISSFILTSLQKDIKTIRIPANVKKLYDTVKREESKLEQKLERKPDVTEIMESLDAQGKLTPADDIAKINHALNLSQFESSLNTQLGNDDESGTERIEMLKNDELSPLDAMITDEKGKMIDQLFELVPRYIREYMFDYFGLHEREQLSVAEISRKYGETEDYIRRNINLYIKKIKWSHMKNRKYFMSMIGAS